MKKITLLVASVLLVGSMAHASENPVFSDTNGKGPRHTVDYRNAEPIMFMERGIEFYVFPDGQFDFNTRPSGPRRESANATYGAPGVRTHYGPANYGVRVEHDNFGRVRRVGNVFINYDGYNRVKRVGSVYMRYNSFALSQVGGLRIMYDRRGHIIDVIGYVNGWSHAYLYSPYVYNGNGGYDNMDYGYDSGSGYNEDDYYYYKADGTKAKMSKEEIETVKKDEQSLIEKNKRT
ncbi:hypothetical protein FLJC2902T_18200 [Flavobacterium limnosediminis JC2902]|uniref:Uncharacterized protein n=1 Tax=Flavobacterium limnosediminis JC2902 TaxID=1341181 RepID=V6SQG2_9FLAO|nr:hypothetical protein [Flavobacterium limnosediminis]ESU28457.1 hypothetical protein FLJC2902T_18200 [Flavobacterium limnosediminis JC2902]